MLLENETEGHVGKLGLGGLRSGRQWERETEDVSGLSRCGAQGTGLVAVARGGEWSVRRDF